MIRDSIWFGIPRSAECPVMRKQIHPVEIRPSGHHARLAHPFGWQCQCCLVAHSSMISRPSLSASTLNVAKFTEDGSSGIASAPNQRRCAERTTPPTVVLCVSVRPHEETEKGTISLRSKMRSTNSKGVSILPVAFVGPDIDREYREEAKAHQPPHAERRALSWSTIAKNQMLRSVRSLLTASGNGVAT